MCLDVTHIVIDGVNGFLYKLKNLKDLTSKTKLYLSLSKEKRKQIDENAKNNIVNRYDQKLVIDHHSRKIEELLNCEIVIKPLFSGWFFILPLSVKQLHGFIYNWRICMY